jgi:hypothetical protein
MLALADQLFRQPRRQLVAHDPAAKAVLRQRAPRLDRDLLLVRLSPQLCRPRSRHAVKIDHRKLDDDTVRRHARRLQQRLARRTGGPRRTAGKPDEGSESQKDRPTIEHAHTPRWSAAFEAAKRVENLPNTG